MCHIQTRIHKLLKKFVRLIAYHTSGYSPDCPDSARNFIQACILSGILKNCYILFFIFFLLWRGSFVEFQICYKLLFTFYYLRISGTIERTPNESFMVTRAPSNEDFGGDRTVKHTS